MKPGEKLNLVPAIREICNQINRAEEEYKAKIKSYYDSLAILRKMNQVCEQCEGTGWVLRSRACAEDDPPDPNDPSDRLTCPVCHGSGLSHYGKDGLE